jgi:hypothetical protein
MRQNGTTRDKMKIDQVSEKIKIKSQNLSRRFCVAPMMDGMRRQ